jgi:hypothetical protein
MTVTVYGLGGFCENCDESHDHPLNNIIEQYEIEQPQVDKRKEILDKLGLTEEEISILLGGI